MPDTATHKGRAVCTLKIRVILIINSDFQHTVKEEVIREIFTFGVQISAASPHLLLSMLNIGE